MEDQTETERFRAGTAIAAAIFGFIVLMRGQIWRFDNIAAAVIVAAVFAVAAGFLGPILERRKARRLAKRQGANPLDRSGS